ncbi:MAG: hypothetical protein V4681_02555 [Patescibacteria group bacterium]
MRQVVVIAALSLLAAACGDDPSSKSPAPQSGAELLDISLPRTPAADAKENDAVAELQIRIGTSYQGTTYSCQYVDEGVALLRGRDGTLYRIKSTEFERFGKSSRRYKSYTLEPWWGSDTELRLSTEETDALRWNNFTGVLCPEDGEKYDRAWRTYRFRDLNRLP